MSGLLVKEYYTLRRYLKQYVILFVFFGAISFYLDSAIYFQAMVTMSICMLAFTGMSYDAAAGWDKFALTMPVSRKDVVRAKYVSCVIYGVIAVVLGTLFSVVIDKIHPMQDSEPILTVIMAMTLICMILVIYSILLPLMYKMGVEKARILMVAVIMVPIFSILGAAEYLPETLLSFIGQHVNLVAAVGVVLCILMYAASYYISVGIFSKKEF